MLGRLDCVMKNTLDGMVKFLASARLVLTGLVTILVFSFLLIPQKSEAGIYANIAPPALIPETPGPPPPWRTYVWIPGHWRWHRNRYDWVPGHYQRPPLGANRWIHGHWIQGRRGWFWIERHWSD